MKNHKKVVNLVVKLPRVSILCFFPEESDSLRYIDESNGQYLICFDTVTFVFSVSRTDQISIFNFLVSYFPL